MDNWNIFQQHNWHNYAWFFCFHDDNESEAVEAHIPRHRDSKTKKPRHRDSKTKKPRHWDFKTIKPRHRETETNQPEHRVSKAFLQRTKSHDIKIPRLKNHDIEIPRLKSHDIKFLWNSDPYAHWYLWVNEEFHPAKSGYLSSQHWTNLHEFTHVIAVIYAYYVKQNMH